MNESLDNSVVEETQDERALIAEVASAYFANPSTRVSPDEIETVLRSIAKGLAIEPKSRSAVVATLPAPQAPSAPVPAVPIAQSVTNDAIYCLEDGKPFKSLKRHLWTKYNLTPEQYRERWSLPADYPMVAPSYSEKRSALAKQQALGGKSE